MLQNWSFATFLVFFSTKNYIYFCSLKWHMTSFFPQKNGAWVQTRVEWRSYNGFLQTSYLEETASHTSITNFLIEVVNYFVGQVSSTNHDLIKHFRPLLVKSSLGPDNHAILKKITAQLVIVKRIQGKSFILIQIFSSV